MFTKFPQSNFSRRGWTLTETMISVGITGILMLVIVAITMTSGRAFAALSNYVDLDAVNQVAMNTLTRDIRECNRVISFSTSAIDIQDSDGSTINYVYSPSAETFTRTKNGVSKVLLTKCSTMTITVAQRKPVGETYETDTPASSAATAKVVNVAWNCYRTILGARANTESVQTARIVIRKQG